MASRKAAVASLPALLLIGALLLLVMAGPGAVSEEDAPSRQSPPASLDRAPEPSPKNSRAVRAGSPVVSTSLNGALPSSPATASAPKGSAAVPPQAPAPQPLPCRESSCLPSSFCCNHADY